MPEYKTVNVPGHCQYLDEEYTVFATYEKIQAPGLDASAHCVEVRCDIQYKTPNKCRIQDCRLIKKAESRTSW